jgi:gamma-glutamylcyclotransferase (GGCT)/AIG2-like uncharacterized protein YtfP
MSVPLFVYGTLKRRTPSRRHALLDDARYVTSASMGGVLYDLGEYPGVVRGPSSRGRVFGELYEIPDTDAPRVLRALDEYEGDEFTRERVYVTAKGGRRRLAWTYVLRKEPPRSARHLPAGKYHHRQGAA